MSNDYNQIILERFFEDALEECLTDAEASRVAYARFWNDDLSKLRKKYYNISTRLQRLTPYTKYPYKYWSVCLRCVECGGEGTLCIGHPNDPSSGTVGCHYCDSEGEVEITLEQDEYENEADIRADYKDSISIELKDGLHGTNKSNASVSCRPKIEALAEAHHQGKYPKGGSLGRGYRLLKFTLRTFKFLYNSCLSNRGGY